jgi:hypothetical protein
VGSTLQQNTSLLKHCVGCYVCCRVFMFSLHCFLCSFRTWCVLTLRSWRMPCIIICNPCHDVCEASPSFVVCQGLKGLSPMTSLHNDSAAGGGDS